MTELSTRSRALLDAARPGIGPSADAVARIRARVDGAVATGAPVGVVRAKLGLAGLAGVVAALVIGGAIAVQRPDASPAPRRSLPASRVEPTRPTGSPATSDLAAAPNSAAPAAAAPAALARPSIDVPVVAEPVVAEPVVAEPVVAEPVVAEPVVAEPVVAEPVVAEPVVAEPVVPRPRESSPAPPIDLAREVALIDRAMAALRAGDAPAALATIRTHARETRGAGQLAEDAAAIEIEAMCQLHDPRVAARLDAFDARFPRSAQRSRLTSTCPSRP